MKLKIKKKQVKPGLFKKLVVEEPDQLPLTKKGKMRYRVNNEVFDIHDSVADNAKAISLIFALLSRIYEALPASTKNRIPAEDRAMVEYAFQKYHSIQTRADVEFAVSGGKELIDRIMERQNKVGQLFKEIYGVESKKSEQSE